MKTIYCDESERHDGQGVIVVVGLLVDTDSQWLPAASLYKAMLDQIPAQHKSAFVFHATTLMHPPSYRDWSIEDRQQLVRNVMSIPVRLKIPIVFGAFLRGARVQPLPGMTARESEHAFALGER